MKLLLDHNLSYKLIAQLSDLYPESSHVAQINLDTASDEEVWNYAQNNGFCLVTKDSDFNDLVASRGFPPKVIWLRVGNCTTETISDLLRKQHASILTFVNDDRSGILQIYSSS